MTFLWVVVLKTVKTERLTQEEERDLARRIREGDGEAWDTMVRENMPLVVYLARDFRGQWDMEDIISEGMIGLMRAVERFDPDKGRFGSYASWWILREIREAILTKAKFIRVPHNTYQMMGKIMRARKKLGDDIGLDELVKETGLKIEVVKKLMNFKSNQVLEFCPEVHQESQVEGDDWRESLDLLLDRLPDRDKNILILLYGLRGERRHTLKEIGDKMGKRITCQRVQQIADCARKSLGRMMKAL